MHNSGANYILIGENEKPKTTLDLSKVEEVIGIISEIIEEDYKFWTNKNLYQPGIERFNLLKKVCAKIKVNSAVFDIAIEELEMERKIITYKDGQFTRYIKVTFNV